MSKKVPQAVARTTMCKDCSAALKRAPWDRVRIHELMSVGGKTHAVRQAPERKTDTWKRTATWSFDAACGVEFVRFVDSSD